MLRGERGACFEGLETELGKKPVRLSRAGFFVAFRPTFALPVRHTCRIFDSEACESGTPQLSAGCISI